MVDRRTFIKTVGLVSGQLLYTPLKSRASSAQRYADLFGVHPFIQGNPDAVFIMKTDVDVKTNSAAIKQAAETFGKSVFVNVPAEQGGVPLTNRVAIKPNLTCRSRSHRSYTVERSMGIVTDAYFVEGVIESIKTLGMSGSQFYMREVNCPEDFEDGGYWDMAERTGADISDTSAEVGVIDPNALVWKEVPGGVWFTNIPYLWPVNAPDTFLLNIAKFKTHGMGLTLCAKNLQGTIAHNYQAHCTNYSSNMDMASEDMNPRAKTDIRTNHGLHKAQGIPRWDRPGQSWNSGIGMETWVSRCLDNNTVTRPDLHIIEGVYGRDGNFMDGPDANDLATDYMTNIIIFGKNPFHNDVIGHWLGGHEPGNFGLFHIAIERGLSKYLNPKDIPLYEWKADGTATPKNLTDFERTPLLTYYLQRDYSGQTEPYWHLCDEPFDYAAAGAARRETSVQPDVFTLLQNYPNPFNPSTSIAFSVPKDGYTRLEVFNARGEIVDVLVDRYCQRGSYMVPWLADNRPSGTYFYRLKFGASHKTMRMTLVR